MIASDGTVGHLTSERTGGPALSLRGLTKRFGTKLDLDRLDLDVPAGRTFGLVGPNGAGKTTTLSMATGLLRPDAGRAWLLGHDVWTDPPAAKAVVGCCRTGCACSTGCPAPSSSATPAGCAASR